MIDQYNNKWIGTYGGGLVKFDGTNWTVFNTINSDLISNYVNSIVFDLSGDLWIASTGGVAKFDGTYWTIFNTSNSGLPDNGVYSIFIDDNDNKWIGTESGLAVFNENGVVFSVKDDFSKNNSNLNIHIYPNPAGDELFVETEYNQQYKVQILDPVGKVVAEYSSDEALLQMNVSMLSSGFYVLVVRSGNEERSAKFLKQ